MPRIAEKLEFKKVRAVKVCAQAETGRSPEHNNPGFRVNSRKKLPLPWRRKILTVHVDIYKIIEPEWRKLWFVRI